jgi:hypothetical protein
MSRETPFELAFAPWRDRFERIRESLDGADSRDRDRFLLDREVTALLLELRPEDGYGDATEAMTGLVHHGYLFWEAGEIIRPITREQLSQVVAFTESRNLRPSDRPTLRPSYVQLPPFGMWGVLEAGPPEPLDGWFAVRSGPSLNLLAVFGIRPGRPGFTTLELRGEPPALDRREDGTPLFAPLQSDAGTRAGMGTVASGAELLELAWRVEDGG